ncbi:MAG: CAP domain-containing protein [Pseudomonadota bacterium]
MRVFVIYITLIGIGLSGCVTIVSPTGQSNDSAAAIGTANTTDAEDQAVASINQARSDQGQSSLTTDPRLIRAAQAHAQDMVSQGYFSHTGANGSTVRSRVTAQGFRGCFWAENISNGRASASEVVNSWMGSPGHRANILHRKARQVGVGKSGNTWVAVFAAPC